MLRSLVLLLKEKEVVPIPVPVNTNRLLEGRVALITGGSSGIGFAIAESFLSQGASVILAGRREAVLRECCDKLNGEIKQADENTPPDSAGGCEISRFGYNRRQ